MAVEVTWDNEEQTIFCYNLGERWTWPEFFAARVGANVLMDTVSHKFVVIIHAPQMASLPPDTLSNSRNALRTAHPNALMVIMVVTLPILRTVIGTLRDIARITPIPIEITATLDEARALARQRLYQQGSASASNH